MLPDIQLTGAGGFVSNALKTLFTPQSSFYTLAASVTQPIFDGFSLGSDVEVRFAVAAGVLRNVKRTKELFQSNRNPVLRVTSLTVARFAKNSSFTQPLGYAAGAYTDEYCKP
jgi:hypothetical protein